jgi:hypothetical protein
MKLCALLLLLITPSLVAFAGSPDCGGPSGYPASMAFVTLKNAGLVTNETTDFARTRVIRLASEKIGKDLYRQIYKVTFTDKSGNTTSVITMNNASNVECSESSVEVFVVSKDLGNITG